MAFQASAGYIQNILLGVMFLRLRLVVTDIAVHRYAGPRMTAGTVAIRSTMIHREGMAANVDVAPGIGIVALRALT